MHIMSNISLLNLKKEKASLERKLTIINLMIDAYSEDEVIVKEEQISMSFQSAISDIVVSLDDDFPINKKWLDQILYLLDDKERFLSNHELAESLMLYHRDCNIDKLKRKVSVIISAAFKNQTIKDLIKVRVSKLPQGNVWGYKKWLDEDGNIIKRHKPYMEDKILKE